MTRNKFTVTLRNDIARLAMSLDTSAAIDGAHLTAAERSELKRLLYKAIDYIDNKIQ